MTIGGVLAAVTLLSSGGLALASSHREAPLISGDPKVDATDLYAFVSPDNSNTVTLIANYLPFEEPAGGPNFYAFDDNALYEIKVDNNGDAVPDVKYQFRFKTTIGNPNTFLYNTGAINSITDSTFNMRQTYTLTRVAGGVSTVLGTDIPVPPVNIGPKSTPNYATLQSQAVKTLPSGVKVFAGQSDDPFYAELGGLFDLLTVRNLPGNAGGGVDGLNGYNVQSLAIQVPITELTSNHSRPTMATDTASVIGVWTTASRHGTRVISADPSANTESGDWVQVSRLGAPLVNEVVVPLGAKDLWNGSNPVNDAQFANGVANPELATLLHALYGINVPPQGAFGTANQRDDLEAIFLTGIPGLTKPATGVPSEQLRLNVAIPPTASPNKLGVLGGDNQGYPNGRRLGDDVVDISLRAVAGAAYPLFHPGFTPDSTGVKLGDGVDANDFSFRNSFPYLALPSRGFESVPHGTQSSVITPPPMGTTTSHGNGNNNDNGYGHGRGDDRGNSNDHGNNNSNATGTGNGSISGIVYNDANDNDIKDAGEAGVGGFMLNLYRGVLYYGTQIMGVNSDGNGMFTFSNLPDGTYSVEQVAKSGWHQGTEDYGMLNISGGSSLANIDFANSMSTSGSDKGNGKNGKNGKKHGNSNWNNGNNNDQ